MGAVATDRGASGRRPIGSGVGRREVPVVTRPRSEPADPGSRTAASRPTETLDVLGIEPPEASPAGGGLPAASAADCPRLRAATWIGPLEIVVGPGGVVVGTAPACDLRIPDPTVSRCHARVRRGGRGVEVEDLGSTNGTWVDGRRVDAATLGPGERFWVSRVCVDVVDEADETLPRGTGTAGGGGSRRRTDDSEE